MIQIDGSYLEGGGQIIRTSVALSAYTGKACSIINIRSNRRNPGLKRQHLASVNAIKNICSAKVAGNELNSTELIFEPNEIKEGSLTIDVGSAGSTALVLQALMIAGMKTNIDVKITGGTINKWAPSISYIQNVTLRMLKKMGYIMELNAKKHGFYPKGGGVVEAKISPQKLKPIELLKRGNPVQIFGSCLASEDLEKGKVADRMQKYAREYLFKSFHIVPEIKKEYVSADSTGGGCDFFVLYENSIIGSNSIVEKGKRAEKVSQEAISLLLENHATNSPLDEHMADQILPYMALTGGKVKVAKITNHCLTNIWVIEKFLDVKFSIDGNIISVNL